MTSDAGETKDLLDHPWFGDAEGHNCIVCQVRDDALHLCWREAHAPLSHRWESFLLRACDALDQYEPDGDRSEHLLAVTRVGANLWAADPFDLDKQAAVMVAALCHASLSGSQGGDR